MFRKISFFLMIAALAIVTSCGSSDNNNNQADDPANNSENNTENNTANDDPMQNKGIGPITSIELGDLDMDLAAQGEEVYNKLCTACHKATEKYIGPAPQGILERRTPEWVMNMILNPVEMTEKDPIAKALMAEYLSPMANQNLTEEEARAVLEYFRTL